MAGSCGRLAPVAVVLVALAASACGLLGDAAPAQACRTPDEGYALTDAELGFELCLPPNWRDLAPGDPGWRVIHGDHTSVEDQVADGTIQHFAVPLAPRETDWRLNLTIYVNPLPADVTVEEAGADYERTLSALKDSTFGAREHDSLPGGEAERLTATLARGEVDRYIAYVMVHDGRGYYFGFAAGVKSGDAYDEAFERVARSITFQWS